MTQQLGLVLFAGAFIVLFVVFAVAEGLGAPSVPEGDIALISSAPAKYEHISEADYKKSLEQQETQAGLKKPPKAGSKKEEELHDAAIGELLNSAWIFGEAEELGIKVTQKEVEAELAKVKKESFKTEKAWQEFLKESHFTEEDVNERLELQILSTKIQEKITNETPPLTEAELESYYEEEKAKQFTKPPTRDVRVVVNENKKEVEEAQKALEADNSAASWKKVTKKYSPTTAAQGGLQKEISEEFLQEPLKKDIFKSETGELIGPVKQAKSWLLLEVVKETPKKVQTFPEVKATIEQTLASERQQKYFTEWVGENFTAKWTSRTQCASGFTTEQCANYKGSGRPAGASEACYEANPKVPAKECPAPVVQNQPAIPGSVSLKTPEGERKVQRPRPEEVSKAAKKEAAEGAEGAAEGAEGSAESEAAQKAVEEAAAKAAEEAASKGASEGKSKGE
ncbi:MAG: SurA N-terminal domain-containing protein [Actinobacteria bacterium]|nr:SurA N-terminal domain-containing protein [Actinomycetota bacterium]